MPIFRFLFWLLLLSNLVLLTLIPGPLPGFSSLEPERLAQQIKPESIRLLSNPLTNASAPASPAPACTEIGDFNSAMATELSPAATHIFNDTPDVSRSVVNTATRMIFKPITGVATETSPCCSARKFMNWPSR